jgi:hypothetical protein
MLLNYIDQPSLIADSSSTASLATTSFRYSVFMSDSKHDAAAIRAMDVAFNSVDKDGWLLHTVDPETVFSPSQNEAHIPP